MDKQIRALYVFFYKNDRIAYHNLGDKYEIRYFVEKYVIFGSPLYFRLMETKSKEAREEWGKDEVFHSRNIKDIKYK